MKKVELRIKELMDKRGLTQTQLSEKCGVRQTAISEMSRNIREQVSLIHLTKIAEALGIDDINELVTIVNEPDKPQSTSGKMSAF